jgi:hypothetical protein
MPQEINMSGKPGEKNVGVKADPQNQSGGEPAATPLAAPRIRSIGKGRFEKKNNPHLPRRLKKAEMKKAQKEARPAA